jgi:hypothetical protein
VCLEAGETATRGKTKAGNRGENAQKSEKFRRKGKMRAQTGVFPQPVKPAFFMLHLRHD